MIALGFETSCDETAVGIVRDGRVLANTVSSQISHARFGGVVPELAARNHIRVIQPLTRIALETAAVTLPDIDLVCATRGPGLIGALLTGLAYARSLALALRKPFIGVNHLEGHLYALQTAARHPSYPSLVLIVSGGHTEVVLVEREFHYRTIARTVDDACGEAFDKVAKIIGLPYPGGPYVERAARHGRIGAIRFPVPNPKRFGFSYSGLKTAVLYYTRQHPAYDANDIAANFQESALEHLVAVMRGALDRIPVKQIAVVGGVSANRRLREKFLALARERSIGLIIPDLPFCMDNGAMIALAGAARFKKFGPSSDVDAVAREPLDRLSG